MGRKNQSKTHRSNKNNVSSGLLHQQKEGYLKLSPQKRNELNKLVEKLLRSKLILLLQEDVLAGCHFIIYAKLFYILVTSTLGVPNNGNKIFDSHLEMEKLLNKIMNIEGGKLKLNFICRFL